MKYFSQTYGETRHNVFQMNNLFICGSGTTTQKHATPLYVTDSSLFYEPQIAHHNQKCSCTFMFFRTPN